MLWSKGQGFETIEPSDYSGEENETFRGLLHESSKNPMWYGGCIDLSGQPFYRKPLTVGQGARTNTNPAAVPIQPPGSVAPRANGKATQHQLKEGSPEGHCVQFSLGNTGELPLIWSCGHLNSCSQWFRADVWLVLAGRGTGMTTKDELARLLQEHPSPMMTLQQLTGAVYKLKIHVTLLKPIHFYDPANADSGFNQLLKWLTEPQRVGVYIVVPKDSNGNSTHAVVFNCDGETLKHCCVPMCSQSILLILLIPS